MAAVISGLILCACVLAVRLNHSPKIYEGGAEVSCRLGKKDFRLYLSFRSGAGQTGESMESNTVRIREGGTAAVPSFLFVKSGEDENAADSFLEQVESCTVTVSPEDGAQEMEVSGPHSTEGINTEAVRSADIIYFPGAGINTICWEIRLKNRDTVRLHHTLECRVQPVKAYYYEDTPMNTVEELNALIEKASAEVPEDAVLELYLPPVTYEGPLTMDTRTANLYGCEEEGKKTVFTDTVTVQTREPYPAEFYSLEFRGDGGCGIRCSEGLRTEYCLFTGWDIGVDVNNGGWISVRNSAFVGNGTGLRFDSESSTYASPNYENVVFAENETGMDIMHVPGDRELNFINPVFDNNQTDFTDPGGRVKISG